MRREIAILRGHGAVVWGSLGLIPMLVGAAFLLLMYTPPTVAANQLASDSEMALWTQTTQEDFQTGERWGVDIYGSPGSMTLLPLSDDFDGASLNLDRWRLQVGGSGIVTQTNGYLEIANNSWGSHGSGLAMLTGDYLQGDVEVQVDFELTDWSPTVYNSQAHFYLRDQAMRYFEIKRDGMSRLGGLVDGYASCYGGSGWYGCLQVLNKGDRSGGFRLIRSGQTFTAFYRDGDQWVALGSVDYYASSTGSHLAGWNWDSMPTFEIRYDNFLVTRNGGVENPTYSFSGIYTSTAYDTGGPAHFGTVSWSPQVQPVETGDGSMKLQIATNSDNATWSFVGPDGTADSYYTQSGQQIWNGHNEDRYVRYRVFLSTQDARFTPRLEDVSMSYLSILEIEVNQALGHQHDDPPKFVASKDTMMRIFLSTPIAVDPTNQWTVVQRDGTTVTTLYPQPSAQPSSVLTFLCPNRDACGNWEAGDYTFAATVNDLTRQRTATFESRRNLRILAVPVKVKEENTVKALPDDQWQTAWYFLRQVYPVANDGVDWQLGSELDATGLNLTSDVQKLLLLVRLNLRQPLLCGKPLRPTCYDQIVGFIPPMTLCDTDPCLQKCGCIGGWMHPRIKQTSVVMANGSHESPCPDNPLREIDSMQGAVAHEIGHTMGLGDEYNHPYGAYECDINPPPPEYVGSEAGTELDCNSLYSCSASSEEPWPDENTGTGSLIRSAVYHPFELLATLPRVEARHGLEDMLSFMGSGQYQRDLWVTPRAYDYLFERLAPPDTIQAAIGSTQAVVFASGWIDRNDTVSLEPWYHFTTTLDSPVSGVYSIEAVDEMSQTLATQGFGVSFTVLSDPPREIELAPFEVVVGFPTGTQAFRIKHGETVLRTISISAGVPHITVIAPVSGEIVSGNYKIVWQATDSDGDHLHYTVEYSPSGDDWIVLAGSIAETELLVDFDALPGGNEARIRVTVTDGVNTSVATSGDFTVSAKPPRVYIESPASGTCHPAGMNITFSGSAYDLQDGWLQSSAALTWNSDRDGTLGGGEVLNLHTLSSGRHVITLSAIDSWGLTASAETVLIVGHCQYLPLVLRTIN